MTDETLVTIEVDGRELKARPGAMLIEVTDAAGINIPRFCYHKKLSVSANCRMCLVEVEKAPKPLPACATPVMNGMKVKTRSPVALAAQKGTMEFLLINHPLDCPICDQGGECELQDVAMGYGAGASRYMESKRVVSDPDMGPLVATDMTRCIHCTRCVRFGAEIAGIREMGATGRGEHMKIGTYIQGSVDSELSGNIIDLCPVGALTSRPFRFQARAWELTRTDSIAPHDTVGSNLSLHVRRNRVLRVSPRDNEAVNECWISDRDRFSYEALDSTARLKQPLVKENGKWRELPWDDALELAAAMLKGAGTALKTLVSPNATLEELYLAQKLTRGLGSNDIDHRLRQSDFRNDGSTALRWLGMPIAGIEGLDAVLVVGGNPRKDQPLIGHRLRKAAMAGALVTYINPCKFDLNYAADQRVESPAGMVKQLAGLAKALGVTGELVASAVIDDQCKALAGQLKNAGKAAIFLGNIANAHPDLAVLETLADRIAAAANAVFGYLLEGSNAVGAQLAGAAPHRLPGGKAAETLGKNTRQMLSDKIEGALLIGVDPSLDCWDPSAVRQSFSNAKDVVALTAFRTRSLESCANLMLPIGWFAETSGTLVNGQGDWQGFAGAVSPIGEARPAWKVLRVLGNLTDVAGFDYQNSGEVLEEVRSLCDATSLDNGIGEGCLDLQFKEGPLTRIGYVPLYAADVAVRHAPSLQRTVDAAQSALLRVNGATARVYELADGAQISVCQGNGEAQLKIRIDEGVAPDCALVPAGLAATGGLGPMFGEITLEKD
ncbi:MAG: NADH-quinone oxidoreductase subunit NuoG [Gammaproteobacteria bacterium]|nr:NADH-quinone oxidoreductase subunit NuoG [Gammaproteobacteria bacterium]MBU1654919.1 NADH-quinone oxidoreductase subunit NuoG [Gammaproteobacteria bacterium]MBU1960368.1 NADH-quinone oxidoreductase subunit NuoG [Gammaproteobacteria bacterium]